MNNCFRSRVLEQAAAGQHEKLDKHRFLVLSTVLEDEDFDRIAELPPQQRADEVLKRHRAVARIYVFFLN